MLLAVVQPVTRGVCVKKTQSALTANSGAMLLPSFHQPLQKQRQALFYTNMPSRYGPTRPLSHRWVCGVRRDEGGSPASLTHPYITSMHLRARRTGSIYLSLFQKIKWATWGLFEPASCFRSGCHGGDSAGHVHHLSNLIPSAAQNMYQLSANIWS